MDSVLDILKLNVVMSEWLDTVSIWDFVWIIGGSLFLYLLGATVFRDYLNKLGSCTTSNTCLGCYAPRKVRKGWASGRKEDYVGMDENYFGLRIWDCSKDSRHFPILRDEWDK